VSDGSSSLSALRAILAVVAGLPPVREEELTRKKESRDEQGGSKEPGPLDAAAAAALSGIRMAEEELRGMESIVERVKGLIALAQSFHEAGDHTESMNLSTLARAEIAKAMRAGTSREASGIRLRYTLPNLGAHEESSWIVQSERVAFDMALREVAAGLDLQVGQPQRDGDEEEIELNTETGEVELRVRRRGARAGDSLVVQVTGEVGDPAVFRALSAAVRGRLSPLADYVDKFASVPPPAEGELGKYLKVLKERMTARVEELIILHSDGRMMCHVTSTHSSGIDYDLVGSMLLALRAFVRDSFAGDFEEVGFGDKRMLLVQGNYVLTALLMVGEASESFRAVVRDSIARMEEELRNDILNWIGVGTIAEKMLPFLEPLVRGARLGSPP
jgi:hypothetical protein